jgi:hypothetical protein
MKRVLAPASKGPLFFCAQRAKSARDTHFGPIIAGRLGSGKDRTSCGDRGLTFGRYQFGGRIVAIQRRVERFLARRNGTGIALEQRDQADP